MFGWGRVDVWRRHCRTGAAVYGDAAIGSALYAKDEGN